MEADSSAALPEERVKIHLAAMEDWINGRASTWNTYAQGDIEKRHEHMAACAQDDAAHVAMHADAVRAYAALIGTGVTFDD